MLTHLAIVLRCGGAVIEERLCRLQPGLRLGDVRGAAVSFPGAVLVVNRDGHGWTAGGHRLVPGRTLTLGFGDFDVSLEAVAVQQAHADGGRGVEVRLAMATMAMLLLAWGAETLQGVMYANPRLEAELTALVFRTDAPGHWAEPAAEAEVVSDTGTLPVEEAPPVRFRAE